LEQAGATAFAFFLNYGYVPNNDRRHAKMEPPPYAWNRNSARLLYEVIGAIKLRGEDVLEVGCDREGNAATVAAQFAPRIANRSVPAEDVRHSYLMVPSYWVGGCR